LDLAVETSDQLIVEICVYRAEFFEFRKYLRIEPSDALQKLCFDVVGRGAIGKRDEIILTARCRNLSKHCAISAL